MKSFLPHASKVNLSVLASLVSLLMSCSMPYPEQTGDDTIRVDRSVIVRGEKLEEELLFQLRLNFSSVGSNYY